MIAAVKFENFFSSRIRSSQPQRAHSGFRAGIDKTDHLHRRHGLPDGFGQLCFDAGRRPVTGSAPGRALDSFDHCRMGMTKDQRAPREHVVDQCISVGIFEPTSFCPCDEQGVRRPLWRCDRPKCANRTIHPARKVVARFKKKFSGFCVTRDEGFLCHLDTLTTHETVQWGVIVMLCGNEVKMSAMGTDFKSVPRQARIAKTSRVPYSYVGGVASHTVEKAGS